MYVCVFACVYPTILLTFEQIFYCVGPRKVHYYFGEGTTTLHKKIAPKNYSLFFKTKNESKGFDFYTSVCAPRGLKEA